MQEEEHVYVWKKLRVDDVVVGFFRLEKLKAIVDAARKVVAVDGPLDPYDGEWLALADKLDALDEGE